MRERAAGIGAGYGEPERLEVAEPAAEAAADHVEDLLGCRIGREVHRPWEIDLRIGRFAVLGIEVPPPALGLAVVID